MAFVYELFLWCREVDRWGPSISANVAFSPASTARSGGGASNRSEGSGNHGDAPIGFGPESSMRSVNDDAPAHVRTASLRWLGEEPLMPSVTLPQLPPLQQPSRRPSTEPLPESPPLSSDRPELGIVAVPRSRSTSFQMDEGGGGASISESFKLREPPLPPEMRPSKAPPPGTPPAAAAPQRRPSPKPPERRPSDLQVV